MYCDDWGQLMQSADMRLRIIFTKSWCIYNWLEYFWRFVPLFYQKIQYSLEISKSSSVLSSLTCLTLGMTPGRISSSHFATITRILAFLVSTWFQVIWFRQQIRNMDLHLILWILLEDAIHHLQFDRVYLSSPFLYYIRTLIKHWYRLAPMGGWTIFDLNFGALNLEHCLPLEITMLIWLVMALRKRC